MFLFSGYLMMFFGTKNSQRGFNNFVVFTSGDKYCRVVLNGKMMFLRESVSACVCVFVWVYLLERKKEREK